MAWVGHETRMRVIGNAYKIFFGNRKEKESSGGHV